MSETKQIVEIRSSPPMHWVGDGFPVSSVVSPQAVGTRLSPLILMDYAGPAAFEPATEPRGVDSHPHRGFETVTVVYKGELEHRDTGGHQGSIGPGDVQWMTAASGVLHEEKHSRRFTAEGGEMEMAQIWFNLPARHKMDPPRYQELPAEAIPRVDLPGGDGAVRVIAGDFAGTAGAARTVTPIVLWDVRFKAGAKVTLPIPAKMNAALFIRSGRLRVDGKRDVDARQLVVLSKEGQGIAVEALEETEFLALGGEPLNEPQVAYGPFVMNTAAEIQKALNDFQAGRFGELPVAV